MSTRRDWFRVSRRRPCPICSRSDWCLIAKDQTAAICARISDGAIKTIGDSGAGWLHRLGECRPFVPRQPRRRSVAITTDTSRTPDWVELTERFAQSITTDGLIRLAANLGVSADSLRRLGIGCVGRDELRRLQTCCRAAFSWSFPMRNGAGIIVGVRLRTPDGFKFAITGSRAGLFIPADLALGDGLWIAEGPTDVAALLDLSFAAVGRPSCTGGTTYVAGFIQAQRPGRVVIVADADAPGRRGAASLASVLRLYAPDVRIITPPKGINDARAWKRAGATRDDVLRTIENADPCRLSLHTQRRVRITKP